MEKTRRAIFFWTLVALFFIITPIVVLNAWGYRFDLNRGVFVHSGTLTIKSNPQNFNVTIDGISAPEKQLNRINSSYNVTDLFPREYSVSLSAEGYQSWQKTINIHSGMATEFWNIILAKKNYTHTPYSTSGTDKFFISPKNDFIAFERMLNSDTSVGILRLSDKSIVKTLSFSGWQFTDDFRRENIEWSPDGDYILIPLKQTVAAPINSSSRKNKSQADSTEYNYFIADPNSSAENINLNNFLEISSLENVR